MSQKPARTDPYQLVTDFILQQLETGVVPWRCPWRRSIGRPRNFATGREYQGINVLLLGILHYPSPWWMTFRQASERGGFVRKGEHGAFVMKWGRHERKVKNGDGSEEKKTGFFLRSYRVFNACQIDGILFPQPETGPQLDVAQRIERAESIASQMPQRPNREEGRTTQASYRISTDTVNMPEFARFNTPEDYYLTLFHELTHATGHPSRLNRKGVADTDGFGGKVYSQEELVAEIGAAFLGAEVQIVRDGHEQSAAYLKGWLEAIRSEDNHRWIVQAASQAGRAADFILGRQPAQPEPTADGEAHQAETAAAFSAG